MSIQSFVPALWAGSLLKNLNDDHVFAKCFNTDYEGEIKGMGSSVKINSIGRVTISDYTRNTDINSPEELDMAGQTLIIDQGKYFNFAVDDVDKKQARGEFMSDAMGEASWGLADTVDDFLGGLLQAGAANTLTAATVGAGAGETSLYDVLVEMGVKLTENNTPMGGRWAVLPPWAEGMIRLDERFIGFGTDRSNARLRGDPVATAAGFTLYVSNNVPRDGSEYSILAGYKGAATFAQQIEKTEAYRPERRFSDAVKGLLIYGGKVTRPSNLVRFDATQGQFRAA